MFAFGSLFQDHMVLQRGVFVPVWGVTEPKSLVRVRCGEVSGRGASNAEGRFTVTLPPMAASASLEFTGENLTTGESVTLSGVAVGEVILAGGQSNMECTLDQLLHAPGEILPDGDLPDVRMFTVPQSVASAPRTGVGGQWRSATAEYVGGFSAAAFYCARRLHKELGVPVGVVTSCWGGTVIETWISREALALNPLLRPMLEQYDLRLNQDASYREVTGEDLNSRSNAIASSELEKIPVDPGNLGEARGWAAPEAPESESWLPIEFPGSWRRRGFDTNGVFWFRREIELPASWAGRDLVLVLGSVDKTDITYFNGEKIGATGGDRDITQYNVVRRYRIPGRLVRANRNVIAVRAVSFIYDGAFGGASGGMRLENGSKSLTIEGVWQGRCEHDYGAVSISRSGAAFGCNAPHALFDSMIAPLVPYAFRAAIWYQGEANASTRNGAYCEMMKSLIQDWRFRFGRNFPFAQVQLANYGEPAVYDDKSTWARIRAGQSRAARELPGVGCVTAIDLGEAEQIHPRDKRTVGERLAAWLLHEAWHHEGEYTGPECVGVRIEGDFLRLDFAHATGGLVARGGALGGFAVAAESGVFVPAEAVIEGDSVRVRAGVVKNPFRVRYAWANNPEGANLYNGAGFAASPFEAGGLFG